MTRTNLVVLALIVSGGASAARPLATVPFRDPASGVGLRVPRIAKVSAASTGYTIHNPGGWRIVWSGSHPLDGRLILEASIPVVPKTNPRYSSRNEALQIGVSADPAAIRTCLDRDVAYNGTVLPDRTIGGIRFVAWSNGDGGMSQSVGARSFRAIVAGRCYAIDRVSYGNTTRSDPAAHVSEAAGVAAMDAALASIRIRR